jgi:hypothetical protein
MAKPTLKVELEVDETADLIPFFTLDDPVSGVLDNTEFPLGGLLFFDVTEYVAGASVSRGISRELDRATAGVASIALNNDTRLFDPLNPASPFSEQLIPFRQIRITANGSAVYLGYVDDWNLQYDLAGNNLSIANGIDGFTLLAQQFIDELAVPVELPGARMERILNLPEVAWEASERDISAGHVPLLAGTVSTGTNALEYLQNIAYTEDGNFFIGSNGDAVLQDGLTGPSTLTLITFSSEGDGVPFTEIEVVYGSELLYNRVEITNIEDFIVTGDSLTSQAAYGIITLSRDKFLADVTEAAIAVVTLLNRYDEPEYRFERILVDITDLPALQQTQLLGSELTNVARIKFQPNNIGAVIDRYAQIIGIKHSIDSKRHKMEFRFRTLDYAPFVLDDPIFGTLGGTQDKYGGASEETYNDDGTSYDANIPFNGTIPPTGISYDANIEYDGEVEEGNRLG